MHYALGSRSLTQPLLMTQHSQPAAAPSPPLPLSGHSRGSGQAPLGAQQNIQGHQGNSKVNKMGA